MGEMKNRNEEYIKDIEYKAGMEFNAVKVGENDYIIPANIVNTNLIESEDFKNSDFFKDEDLKRAICKLEVKDGDYISVSCSNVLEDGRIVVDILNVDDPSKITQVTVDSDLGHEEREMLVTMIADAHREHKDVHVSFYIGCDFEALEELVNSEEKI